MVRQKLLLWSDSPERVTGLGRILRELTQQMTQDAEFLEMFDVATLGYQGMNSCRFPWPQYHHQLVEADFRWLDAVDDWAEGGEVIIFPIMPPSWLFTYLRPELTNHGPRSFGARLAELSKRIRWWPYVAVEGCTMLGTLGLPATETLKKCERILWYSKWGQEVGARSGFDPDVPWVHHGIDWKKFSQTVVDWPRMDSRPVVGCVMTNQWRKRWNLVFEAMAQLKEVASLFILVDSFLGYWDLNSLADLHQIPVQCRLSGPTMTDEKMIEFYGNCDVGVLASYGEGFGYPVLEFMAQGKPVVTGTWGAQAELTGQYGFLVPPTGHETDGVHCHVKPFYESEHWKTSINLALKVNHQEATHQIQEHAKQWDWLVQWPRFKEWFMKGVK